MVTDVRKNLPENLFIQPLLHKTGTNLWQKANLLIYNQL